MRAIPTLLWREYRELRWSVLPTIQAARERDRRTVCQHNVHLLTIAAMRHADHHGFMPGWRNDATIHLLREVRSWNEGHATRAGRVE